MKNNLKAFAIVISFVMMISIACASVSTVIPTEAPTQTALPTYTPQPTYTPFPTLVPPTKMPPTDIPIETQAQPTSVPDTSGKVIENNEVYKGSGPVQVACPDSVNPIPQADKVLCYVISDVGMGLIYLSNDNTLIAYAIAISTSSENNAYDCGVFAAQVADVYGWNPDDVVGVLQKIKEFDTTYTYGMLNAIANPSDDSRFMYIMFMPAGGLNG
jgi:hypothetical protein